MESLKPRPQKCPDCGSEITLRLIGVGMDGLEPGYQETCMGTGCGWIGDTQ